MQEQSLQWRARRLRSCASSTRRAIARSLSLWVLEERPDMEPVLCSVDSRGVATVTLNRPEVNNAYDAGLISGLLQGMDRLDKAPGLRAVVLKGNGKHFQAGA